VDLLNWASLGMKVMVFTLYAKVITANAVAVQCASLKVHPMGVAGGMPLTLESRHGGLPRIAQGCAATPTRHCSQQQTRGTQILCTCNALHPYTPYTLFHSFMMTLPTND
jgi:hypothetical protein